MFLIVAVTDLKEKVRTAPEYRPEHGSPGVPQIWLTYDELAALMNCDPAAARTAAAAMRLDRRRSRDGFTRAKLTPSLTDAFLDKVLWQRLEQEIATRAADLWTMRDRMAAPSAAVPDLRAAGGR
jgi:hypothetical protein